MALHTLTIGAPTTTLVIPPLFYRLTWDRNISVPAGDIAGESGLTITEVNMTVIPGANTSSFQITLSTRLSRFSTTFEDEGTATLNAGNLSYSVDFDGHDTASPYQYDPPAAGLLSFITQYNGLTSAQKNATTLTLNDNAIAELLAEAELTNTLAASVSALAELDHLTPATLTLTTSAEASLARPGALLGTGELIAFTVPIPLDELDNYPAFDTPTGMDTPGAPSLDSPLFRGFHLSAAAKLDDPDAAHAVLNAHLESIFLVEADLDGGPPLNAEAELSNPFTIRTAGSGVLDDSPSLESSMEFSLGLTGLAEAEASLGTIPDLLVAQRLRIRFTVDTEVSGNLSAHFVEDIDLDAAIVVEAAISDIPILSVAGELDAELDPTLLAEGGFTNIPVLSIGGVLNGGLTGTIRSRGDTSGTPDLHVGAELDISLAITTEGEGALGEIPLLSSDVEFDTPLLVSTATLAETDHLVPADLAATIRTIADLTKPSDIRIGGILNAGIAGDISALATFSDVPELSVGAELDLSFSIATEVVADTDNLLFISLTNATQAEAALSKPADLRGRGRLRGRLGRDIRIRAVATFEDVPELAGAAELSIPLTVTTESLAELDHLIPATLTNDTSASADLTKPSGISASGELSTGLRGIILGRGEFSNLPILSAEAELANPLVVTTQGVAETDHLLSISLANLTQAEGALSKPSGITAEGELNAALTARIETRASFDTVPILESSVIFDDDLEVSTEAFAELDHLVDAEIAITTEAEADLYIEPALAESILSADLNGMIQAEGEAAGIPSLSAESLLNAQIFTSKKRVVRGTGELGPLPELFGQIETNVSLGVDISAAGYYYPFAELKADLTATIEAAAEVPAIEAVDAESELDISVSISVTSEAELTDIPILDIDQELDISFAPDIEVYGIVSSPQAPAATLNAGLDASISAEGVLDKPGDVVAEMRFRRRMVNFVIRTRPRGRLNQVVNLFSSFETDIALDASISTEANLSDTPLLSAGFETDINLQGGINAWGYFYPVAMLNIPFRPDVEATGGLTDPPILSIGATVAATLAAATTGTADLTEPTDLAPEITLNAALAPNLVPIGRLADPPILQAGGELQAGFAGSIEAAATTTAPNDILVEIHFDATLAINHEATAYFYPLAELNAQIFTGKKRFIKTEAGLTEPSDITSSVIVSADLSGQIEAEAKLSAISGAELNAGLVGTITAEAATDAPKPLDAEKFFTVIGLDGVGFFERWIFANGELGSAPNFIEVATEVPATLNATIEASANLDLIGATSELNAGLDATIQAGPVNYIMAEFIERRFDLTLLHYYLPEQDEPSWQNLAFDKQLDYFLKQD